MEITDKHVDSVLSFAAFSAAYCALNNPLLALVFALGAYKGMRRVRRAKAVWNEESVDPSKVSN